MNQSFIHSSLDDAGLSASEFRVFCHILRRQGKNGPAYPSLDSMASVCHLERKTVMRALRGLISRNMVARISRKGTSSTYEAKTPDHWNPATRSVKPTTTQSHRHPDHLDHSAPREGISNKGNPSEVFQCSRAIHTRAYKGTAGILAALAERSYDPEDTPF